MTTMLRLVISAMPLLAFALGGCRGEPTGEPVVLTEEVEVLLTPWPTPEQLTGVDQYMVKRPSSPPAEPMRRYSFALGHCGFSSPVDFDGSFWNVVAMTANFQLHSVNSTAGTMMLLSDNTAEFRGPEGFVARLERVVGDYVPYPCA